MAAQPLRNTTQGDDKAIRAQFRTAGKRLASEFDPRDIPEEYHEGLENKRRRRERLRRVQQSAAHLGRYMTDGEVTEYVHWVMNAHRERHLHPHRPGDRRAKRRRRFLRQHGIDADT